MNTDYEALKQSMNQILTYLGLDPENLPSGSYSEIVIGSIQTRAHEVASVGPVAQMTVINAGAVTYRVAPAAKRLPAGEYWLYAAPSATGLPIGAMQIRSNQSALEHAARAVLETELADLACTGSDAPAEHALGLLDDALNGLSVAIAEEPASVTRTGV